MLIFLISLLFKKLIHLHPSNSLVFSQLYIGLLKNVIVIRIFNVFVCQTRFFVKYINPCSSNGNWLLFDSCLALPIAKSTFINPCKVLDT